jgi:hypothetical protein
MNHNPAKKHFSHASLRTPGSARTVLLRMAADQERADRIRALKAERPDLTWRRIADYVGVSERAASDWQKKGGIEYDNAKKLAEVFEVDVDYIWRGPSEADRAPSPVRRPDALADRLDAGGPQRQGRDCGRDRLSWPGCRSGSARRRAKSQAKASALARLELHSGSSAAHSIAPRRSFCSPGRSSSCTACCMAFSVPLGRPAPSALPLLCRSASQVTPLGGPFPWA